jgi:pyrophosphatase PpaX
LSPNRRAEAILWDLDGTLADTHPLIHRCVDETFQKYFSRPFEFDLWKQGVGRPLEHVLRLGFEKYGITCEDTAPLISFYRERLASYECDVRPFPGAADIVGRLAGMGFRQGVVTTKFGEACERHLDTLGLARHFEVVITGDSCERHKPDPEPIRRALEALKLPPVACVMVGDSAADVSSARSCGVKTIAALWGSLDRDAVLSARPDYSANMLSDVLTIATALRSSGRR